MFGDESGTWIENVRLNETASLSVQNCGMAHPSSSHTGKSDGVNDRRRENGELCGKVIDHVCHRVHGPNRPCGTL